MHTSDFNYTLPSDQIAQRSAEPRDHARLMVVNREKRTIEHKHFFDIVDYLEPGDLIVWNNSKVFKARLFGILLSEDGKVLRDHTKPVEIFLVRPMENFGVWKVLARPGKHVRAGTRIVFLSKRSGQTADDFYCDVLVKEKNDGTILVQFPYGEAIVRAKANEHGRIPIPPYVKDEPHEIESYQTVYATEEGSVAAPTAGFHFTPALIDILKKKGVVFAEVTLHVGLGTFLPVKAERVEDHTMHSEFVEVSAASAEAVNRAKAEGRRVIAIGTTTVRTLEGIALFHENVLSKTQRVSSYSGDINLFILPGFQFQIVDAMITNFHLPKSTLLMLVAAFAGDREFMLECYQEAVRKEYRFYSFGDAMLIL